MIAGKTKKELLDEIRKFGNVYLSCLKIGIDRATYYRWKKTDEKFKEKASEAERIGRENICDVAGHALMQNVKNKDQRAIEYVLNHNSEKYKQKQTSHVVIVHKKDVPIPNTTVKTLEDLIDDSDKNAHEYALELQKRFTSFGREIPNKPDGKPIELDELASYEAYVENWQKCKENGDNKKRDSSTDIVDQNTKI